MEGEEGGDVDDGAAAAQGVGLSGQKVGAEIAAESKDTGEVDLEHLLIVVMSVLRPTPAWRGSRE